MKKSLLAFAAIAFAATLAAPSAGATTFPTLTQIYAASGVIENSVTAVSGLMTAISCTNMSGQTASVRYVFRREDGTIAAGGTLLVGSLASRVVTTQGSNNIINAFALPTSFMTGGSLQVLSTESAVFCSAMMVNAAGTEGPGVDLHMVRFNPHPGTVE